MGIYKLYKKAKAKRYEADILLDKTEKDICDTVKKKIDDNHYYTDMGEHGLYYYTAIGSRVYVRKISIELFFIAYKDKQRGRICEAVTKLERYYTEHKKFYKTKHKIPLCFSMNYNIDIEQALRENFTLDTISPKFKDMVLNKFKN